MNSPLVTRTAFEIGPLAISDVVVTTWALMALLVIAAILSTRRLSLEPSRGQAALELVVEALDAQIRNTMRAEPARYRPLAGTLFVFILAANWASIIPGVEPPTAHLETDAALGLIVFASIVYFGVRAHGPFGYLKTFAEPNVLLIPLNIVETFTRTFSMIVRLFGNVMSGVFIIGIVLSLAGLLVPVPLMALELLTGAIQAYIFTILAMVFIASVVAEPQAPPEEKA